MVSFYLGTVRREKIMGATVKGEWRTGGDLWGEGTFSRFRFLFLKLSAQNEAILWKGGVVAKMMVILVEMRR